jgi:hypothetical protein
LFYFCENLEELKDKDSCGEEKGVLFGLLLAATNWI